MWSSPCRKTQTTYLRDLALRVQIPKRIRVLWLCVRNTSTTKVRHLSNLILKHMLDSLRLEDLFLGCRTRAFVQQNSKHLDIFRRTRIQTSTTTVQDPALFFFAFCNQWPAVYVISFCGLLAAWPALVHRSQIGLHLLGREHVCVVDAQGLEDVLLHVLIQSHPGLSFECDACPVDVDAVFPSTSWLVDQRHSKNFVRVATEDVETDRAPIVSELCVEEFVSETCGLWLGQQGSE
jgi:hypothetical protein